MYSPPYKASECNVYYNKYKNKPGDVVGFCSSNFNCAFLLPDLSWFPHIETYLQLNSIALPNGSCNEEIYRNQCLYAKLCDNTLYRRYLFCHYSLFSHLNSSISLPLPLNIEFPVPSQKSELSCIFVSGVTLSMIVLSILELLRQCSMFYFSFYLYLKCWLLKLIFEDFFQILKLLRVTIFKHVSINHVFQIVCFTYGRTKSTSPIYRYRY